MDEAKLPLHPVISKASCGASVLQDRALRSSPFASTFASTARSWAVTQASTRKTTHEPLLRHSLHSLGQQQTHLLSRPGRVLPIRLLRLPFSVIVRPALDVSDWQLSDAGAVQLALDLPPNSLTALNMNCCSQSLTPDSMLALAKRLGPSLKVLSAEYCPAIVPRVLMHAKDAFHNLRALSVSFCPHFNDQCASAVARSC